MNNAQIGALLDVVDQCRVVRAAHEQKQAHKAHGQQLEVKEREKAREAVLKAYREAWDEMVMLYSVAKDEGVSRGTLESAMLQAMPADSDKQIQELAEA